MKSKKKFNPTIDKIKRNIREAFFKLGIDLTSLKEDPTVQLLRSQKIDLVLDIGANEGQYAMELLKKGYKKEIISFEPLSPAYQKLWLLSRKFPNWKVYKKCAIGEKNGEIKINVSYNSLSSSILPILESSTGREPLTGYKGIEKVKMYKLESVWEEVVGKNNKKNIFLKMDVQGYEENVLKGALKILQNIRGIQLECSLVKLYEGEKLFEEMIEIIEGHGFKMYDIHPAFRDSQTGRLLQVDCTFFRE